LCDWSLTRRSTRPVLSCDTCLIVERRTIRADAHHILPRTQRCSSYSDRSSAPPLQHRPFGHPWPRWHPYHSLATRGQDGTPRHLVAHCWSFAAPRNLSIVGASLLPPTVTQNPNSVVGPAPSSFATADTNSSLDVPSCRIAPSSTTILHHYRLLFVVSPKLRPRSPPPPIRCFVNGSDQ
jgi:hypothetical protein